jgi:hypothetical protein
MTKEPGTVGNRKEWTLADVQKLRQLAREGTAEAAATVLNRSVTSVRQKAMKSGISFRPAQPAALRK